MRSGVRNWPSHVALVSYLFPPSDASAVRRVVGIRNALHQLSIRTTVITSAVSGQGGGDGSEGVIQAPDLRAWAGGRHQAIAGRSAGAITWTERRWWTRLIVPDTTVVTWAPTAIHAAAALARDDRPDLVLTSSPPESVHCVGLAMSLKGIPWIADLRDGWTFEPPTLRPYFRRLDRRLERLVVERADRVTAVTEPIVDDLADRHRSARVEHLTNGFDPVTLRQATDERSLLDSRRFSLVYTGSGGIDGKDPRPFLRALTSVVQSDDRVRQRLEVVFAGNFTDSELEVLQAPTLAGVVKVLGRVEHRRALGLQRASDALLLITSVGVTQVATAKIYEYLAARKPILGLAVNNAAAQILHSSGGHVLAPPDDESIIAFALRRFLERWISSSEPYEPYPEFDVDAYGFPRITERLLDIYAEMSADSASASRMINRPDGPPDAGRAVGSGP